MLPGKKRAEQLAEKAQLPQYSIPAVMGSGILPTRDDLLKRIEAALMVDNTSAEPDANQPERCTVYFPTIEQVADSWRLKGKQRDAFRLMSTAMLQKIHANNCVQHHEDNVRSHAITNSFNTILPNNKRLCMYFGGAAGTGKSTVIHALVNFADMWCSTASVAVCASSGIAAMLIGGSTVHSALGIRPNGPHRCPSAAMRKAWSEVEILIIDECSLIDAELLDVLDKRLTQLKFKSNEDVAHGVANGTVCYLRDVILAPSAQVTIETLPRNVQVHSVSADDVECLVLEHRLEKWNCSAAFETLPVGMFPLSPHTSTIDNPLAKTRGAPQIRITQFPCKSAVALTVHKTQGQTLASVLLGPANRHFRHGAQGWLYVILSRVPTLGDLFVTESLPRNPQQFKPRVDVIGEMRRLHDVERETLRRIKPADEAQPTTL